MSTQRKSALGKGLGALLGSKPVAILSDLPATKTGEVVFISLEDITMNPRQPRTNFSRETIAELAESIKTHGVLQPVLVTKDKKRPGQYILLAGERRFRAATVANLKQIPALVSEVTDEEMLEIAIVENVQREDLNVVDEARAYRQLVDAFGWSQEQISERVGKNRTTVSNALRLLKLNDDALADLEEGRMTAGHARAILSIEDPFYRARLRQEIVTKGISVREAERMAKLFQKNGPPTKKKRKKDIFQNQAMLDTVALEERLMAHLGCRVRVRSKDGQAGTVEIPFENPDELERFLQAIHLEE